MRARLVASIAIAAALAVGLSAQAANTSWSVPRMPDGRPDMQAVWANNGMTQTLIDGGDAFKKTGEQMFEYACHEGNYGLRAILSGARAQEQSTR